MEEKHAGLVGFLQRSVKGAVLVQEYERLVRRWSIDHGRKVVATVGGRPQWLVLDGSDSAVVVTITGVTGGLVTGANVNTILGFPAATVMYENDVAGVAYVDVV